MNGPRPETGTNLDEHGHARFSTISNASIRRLYTQADLPADWDYDKYLGYPGEPPYTRGIHATGYRGKLWTNHPTFRATISELWMRLQRRLGFNSSWSPVISIAAVGPCAIETLPWDELATIRAN